VALDPEFSAAWFALGFAYESGAFVYPELADEWRPKSAAAVDRGRTLAPNSPLALLTDANKNAERGAWREAAAFFEREQPAVLKYPTLRGRFAAGDFLLRVGRTREAIRYFERARADEPLSAEVALFLGEAYADAGALAPALAEFDRGREFGELRLFIARGALQVALASGDRQEIDRRYVAALENDLVEPNFDEVMGRFLDDRESGAAEIRRVAASEVIEQPFVAYMLADWAAYYDEPETALLLLRNTSGAALAMWRPLFADMRKLPGFKDLVREMGLVDYWREFGWSDYCRPIGDDDFECEYSDD
jgi:tetratricopeptide (TPR) repeat protein